MTYYKVKMPEAYARIQWCRKTFGPPFQNLPKEQRQWNNMRWYRCYGTLCFREEADYLLYLLRWA